MVMVRVWDLPADVVSRLPSQTMIMAQQSVPLSSIRARREDVERARATAESGLRWISYRFRVMARPKTTVGNIDATTADTLWTPLATAAGANKRIKVRAPRPVTGRYVLIWFTRVPPSEDINAGVYQGGVRSVVVSG